MRCRDPSLRRAPGWATTWPRCRSSRPRSPAGTLAGVSAFQVHIWTTTSRLTTPTCSPSPPKPRRRATSCTGSSRRTAIVADTFDSATSRRRATSWPAARGRTGGRVPMTLYGQGATAPLGVKPRTPTARKLLRPRADLLGVFPARRPGLRLDRQALRQGGTPSRRTGPRFPGWLELRRDLPRCSTTSTRSRRPTCLPRWKYPQITGNTALAWGLVAAGQQANLGLPRQRRRSSHASDAPPRLSSANFGVPRSGPRTNRPVGTALGAAFAGHLGVTTTSETGRGLKSETISLAARPGRLPLLIIDIQRWALGLPQSQTEAPGPSSTALYGPSRRRRMQVDDLVPTI